MYGKSNTLYIIDSSEEEPNSDDDYLQEKSIEESPVKKAKLDGIVPQFNLQNKNNSIKCTSCLAIEIAIEESPVKKAKLAEIVPQFNLQNKNNSIKCTSCLATLNWNQETRKWNVSRGERKRIKGLDKYKDDFVRLDDKRMQCRKCPKIFRDTSGCATHLRHHKSLHDKQEIYKKKFDEGGSRFSKANRLSFCNLCNLYMYNYN